MIPGIVRQSACVDICLRSTWACLLVFGLVAAYLYIFAFTIHGRGDEGLQLYPAERLLNGQIPYRDFFSELAPGTFFIQAALFKVFGTHLLSARLPMLLIMAAIGWQIFFLSRKILPLLPATLPVIIFTVTAFTRCMVVSHHWYSLFFALAATISLVSYFQGYPSRRWLLFLAGLFVSACGLCMQSKGAFLLLAALLILFMDYRNSQRQGLKASLANLASFSTGAMVLASIPLYYFYLNNAIRDLIYCTYTYLWQSYLPYEYQPLPFSPVNLWRQSQILLGDFSLLRLGKTFSALLWSTLIPLAAALCIARSYRAAEGSRPDLPVRKQLLTLYFLVGLALMFSELHRFDFMHSLFGAPVLLILAVAFIHDLVSLPTPGTRAASALLIAVAIFYLVHGGSLAWREMRRNTAVHTRRGIFYQTPERAARFERLIDMIETRVQPGAPVFLYPYSSMLYFLTATHNPTRFDYLLPGQTTSAQFDEVFGLLKSAKAPPVVISFWRERKDSLPERFPTVSTKILADHPLERFLQNHATLFKPQLEDTRFVLYERSSSP